MNGHAPPASPRTPGHAAGASLLGLLLGATATALGVLVSWWLVPPYLLGMIWLLLPEGVAADWRRRLRAARPADEATTVPRPGPEGKPEPNRADRPVRRPATVATEGAPEPATAAAVAVAPPRRKRATRKPKVAPVTAEPVAATWVQVGPGRFVRVEVGGPPAEPAGAPVPEPGILESPEAVGLESDPVADPQFTQAEDFPDEAPAHSEDESEPGNFVEDGASEPPALLVPAHEPEVPGGADATEDEGEDEPGASHFVEPDAEPLDREWPVEIEGSEPAATADDEEGWDEDAGRSEVEDPGDEVDDWEDEVDREGHRPGAW
jgi:hypothetical protein